MKQEVIKDMLQLTEKEIIKNELFIDFYTKLAQTQPVEDGAKTMLKVEQMKSSYEFNKNFYDYLKSL